MGIEEVHFATGVCQRHRELFLATCMDCGIRDFALMNHVRMMVVATCGRRFSDVEMLRYIHHACVGCEHEDWCVANIRRLCQDMIAFRNKGRGLGG